MIQEIIRLRRFLKKNTDQEDTVFLYFIFGCLSKSKSQKNLPPFLLIICGCFFKVTRFLFGMWQHLELTLVIKKVLYPRTWIWSKKPLIARINSVCWTVRSCWSRASWLYKAPEKSSIFELQEVVFKAVPWSTEFIWLCNQQMLK